MGFAWLAGALLFDTMPSDKSIAGAAVAVCSIAIYTALQMRKARLRCVRNINNRPMGAPEGFRKSTLQSL